MNPFGQSNIRILSADQQKSLLAIPARLTGPVLSRESLLALVMHVGDVFGGEKVACAQRRRGTWKAVAESAANPQLPASNDAAWQGLDAFLAPGVGGIELWRYRQMEWTVVRLPSPIDLPAVLMIAGDWTLSSATLAQFASTVFYVERAFGLSFRAQTGMAAHRLTRALGAASGMREACEVVLRHAARAVPSRFATCAIPLSEDSLSIVATFGYPVAMVEHVRITPGVGIIGSVYRNRTAISVPDITGTRPRRPRYRTNSFVAIPVVDGSNVLGVVCLADRLDGLAFTRGDLLILRALMAPAALALAREGARRQAQSYARAAVTDPVSGLFNRRYFHVRLEEEVQRAQRHQLPIGLLMIDIDDFKSINDRFGHMAGDRVIRDLSDIMRRSVRLFDICTRFGGEEFAVVMPGGDIDSARSVAERIRQRIEAYRPEERELADLRVTVSIGFSAAQDISMRDLIERADNALYAAKRTGKNRVVVVASPSSSDPHPSGPGRYTKMGAE